MHRFRVNPVLGWWDILRKRLERNARWGSEMDVIVAASWSARTIWTGSKRHNQKPPRSTTRHNIWILNPTQNCWDIFRTLLNADHCECQEWAFWQRHLGLHVLLINAFEIAFQSFWQVLHDLPFRYNSNTRFSSYSYYIDDNELIVWVKREHFGRGFWACTYFSKTVLERDESLRYVAPEPPLKFLIQLTVAEIFQENRCNWANRDGQKWTFW